MLRFSARKLSKAKVGADDYMISAALGAIATELFYCAAIASVKLSCLLLYRRLFPVKGFIRILWSVGGFIVCYTVVQILLIIFQCRPISRAWDPSVKAECINIGTATTAIAALNVATDFTTLTLPLPLIWRLQLPTAQKLQVSGIFLLGGFVCIVSIYRTTIIGKLSLADASWSDIDPCVWSAVEVCVGIVSACLPTLRPLWTAVSRPQTIFSTLKRKAYVSRPGFSEGRKTRDAPTDPEWSMNPTKNGRESYSVQIFASPRD
ncbi:MAG: hypothetical protein Q9186_004025 [Xanthomendoza sp. 1 TL-2023]